ncbi:MAG: hypothetical protein R6W78_12925 [Bacteroidales bacterium]
MQKYIKIFFAAVFVFVCVTCDKWDDTADISHITYLPEFEMAGGEFISIMKDSAGFKLPSVRATVQGKDVNWYYMSNYFDVTTPGVYIIKYYAENDEGFSKTAERILAVTYEPVTNNNLSGVYQRNVWGPAEMTLTKTDPGGLYKCSDVMGFPGLPMPGKIVDLGRNRLALLPGEGYFGRYDASEGSYSKYAVSWSVFLLDPPNEGIEIPVTWGKIE